MPILCFPETIKGNPENLQVIKPLANGSRLTEEWVKAKRVAGKIINEAHFECRFEELGFEHRLAQSKSCIMVSWM